LEELERSKHLILRAGPDDHAPASTIKEARTMLRRRFVVLSLFAVLAFPITGGILSRPALADEITVSGEILDLACYIAQGAKGAEHKKCAVKCAQMGQPVGLLAADGKVYLLVADHVDQAPYEKARKQAGDKVTIKGEVDSKDGISVLTVKEIK
jgi:hypothetical protein